jgi:hypothetical protein
MQPIYTPIVPGSTPPHEAGGKKPSATQPVVSSVPSYIGESRRILEREYLSLLKPSILDKLSRRHKKIFIPQKNAIISELGKRIASRGVPVNKEEAMKIFKQKMKLQLKLENSKPTDKNFKKLTRQIAILENKFKELSGEKSEELQKKQAESKEETEVLGWSRMMAKRLPKLMKLHANSTKLDSKKGEQESIDLLNKKIDLLSQLNSELKNDKPNLVKLKRLNIEYDKLENLEKLKSLMDNAIRISALTETELQAVDMSDLRAYKKDFSGGEEKLFEILKAIDDKIEKELAKKSPNFKEIDELQHQFKNNLALFESRNTILAALPELFRRYTKLSKIPKEDLFFMELFSNSAMMLNLALDVLRLTGKKELNFESIQAKILEYNKLAVS